MQTNQDLSFPRECERKFLLLCPHCADICTVSSSSQSSRNMKNALLGVNVSFILAIRECVFAQACDSVTQSELQRVIFWGLVRSRKIWTVGMSRSPIVTRKKAQSNDGFWKDGRNIDRIERPGKNVRNGNRVTRQQSEQTPETTVLQTALSEMRQLRKE